jgi:hypothetical protein
MEKFEEIRKKALELFEQRKYLLRVHSLGRMTERSIYPSDIKLVLLHGSLYKKEIDDFGDTRYTMRVLDRESKNIRITFILKDVLIIITVIREEEVK